MISIVVPVHNEAEVILQLHLRLTKALGQLGETYEVIVVDDGSTDNSKAMLEAFHDRDPRWKLLCFSRNFGHQAAISAGLHYSQGDVVVVMDADLQDPPEALAGFLQKWREGYQVVYAIRSRRKENVAKRFAYWLFYRTLRRLSPIAIPLDSGDFCVLDRTVVDVLRSLPERKRFVRGLRTWAGFRQIGIPYERHARLGGETKYTIPKLFDLALDGIVSFSSAPLRIASWIGISFCAASLSLIGLVILWWALDLEVLGMRPRNAVGWTSLICLVLLSSGIQMLLAGIMGEYMARMYDEVKGREPWIIGDARGFDPRTVDGGPGWYVSRGRYSREARDGGSSKLEITS
jgi:glycosyltransferase involved in cell wall biosynthesis